MALRSTMSDERLLSLAVLYVHKHKEVLSEFAGKKDRRKYVTRNNNKNIQLRNTEILLPCIALLIINNRRTPALIIKVSEQSCERPTICD